MTRKDRVILTVDVVNTDAQGRILVMERGTEPFKGCWVLPGGIVEPGETVEPAPPWLSIVGLSAYDAQGPTN